jgi:hypothetical protein
VLSGKEAWQLGQWRGAEKRERREKKAGRMERPYLMFLKRSEPRLPLSF